MLDDALIHWRYAQNLQDHRGFTYNGDLLTYGNSSLLYLGLLTLLRVSSISPLTPKCLSVFAYLLLLLCVSGPLLARKVEDFGMARFGLLLTLLSPFAIRWLSDGMETSTTVLAAYLLAAVTDTVSQRKHISFRTWSGLSVMGFAIEALRVELALMLFLACAVINFERVRLLGPRRTRPSLPGLTVSSSALGVGGLLAMAAIIAQFHYLLPDTALAKQGVPGLAPFMGVITATASSSSLGLGMLTMWLYTGFSVLRVARQSGRSIVPWLLVNSCWPIVVALAVGRGQAIQGVRYLIESDTNDAAADNLSLRRRLKTIRPAGAIHRRNEIFLSLRSKVWILGRRSRLCTLPLAGTVRVLDPGEEH